MARVLKAATVVAAAAVSIGGLLPRLQTSVPAVRALSTSQAPPRVARAVWSLGQLNHVAIAVPDLEKARAFYRDVLGAQVSEAVPLPDHGVSVVFVNLGNTKMELLHPLGNDSPIAGFLQKNKAGGMHHVCIEGTAKLHKASVCRQFPGAGLFSKDDISRKQNKAEKVDDIRAAVADLKEKKIRSLSEEAKIGAHGKPVIFLHPKDCGGVLVELEQA